MKKKLFAIVAIAAILVMALTGCQAAMVSSNVEVNKDGSGTKTITAVILGDNSVIPGTEENESPSTVGNNSKYLLVYGDDLAAKIKSYCALTDVTVTATEKDGDTTVVITYSFTSMDDYNRKTKTLAKDEANMIEDATFTDNGDGTYTFKECSDNTQYTVDNIFESLFYDETAFDTSGGGDLELDSPQYGYTQIYKVMSASATVGGETVSTEFFKYDNSGTGSGTDLDYDDYLEVTSDFSKVPTDGGDGDGPNVGLIVGIVVAAVVVIGGAVAAAVIVNKKKQNKTQD